MKRFLLISTLILVFAAIPDTVCAESAADEWQFQLTPYIWLPTIDGTLNYELPPRGGSARKGRFSLST
jgi:hypothetical protein